MDVRTRWWNPDGDPTRIGIGAYLKTRRMERGVTLEHIAAATRVRRGLLEALERDDYDLLPAPIFVKGFLRGYCRCLDLDAEPIVAAFDHQMPGREETDDESLRKFRPRNTSERMTRAFVSFLRLLN